MGIALFFSKDCRLLQFWKSVKSFAHPITKEFEKQLKKGCEVKKEQANMSYS